MLEEGNLVMQGLYLITHVALLDPESVNLLLEHSIVPDGFATLAKARVHALTVLVDVITQVTQLLFQLPNFLSEFRDVKTKQPNKQSDIQPIDFYHLWMRMCVEFKSLI